jgi:prevent-host-death family protein
MTKSHQVNMHEAKTHLSRLVDQVAAGAGDIVIAKAGKPLALLTRLPVDRPQRTPGFPKDRIRVAEDFDAPLPQGVLETFEGKREPSA